MEIFVVRWKGSWESYKNARALGKAKRRFQLFAPLVTPCRQKCGQEGAGYKGGVICEYLAFWCLCLSVYYIYGVVIFIAFAVNEKKINMPTICWPSSEFNNKFSHVTNLPEGATQILLQTICNHQILRTIFYFQSAQKWKWILEDHLRETIASFHRAVSSGVGLQVFTQFLSCFLSHSFLHFSRTIDVISFL